VALMGLSFKYLFLLLISSFILCSSLSCFFYIRLKQAKFAIPKTYHFIGIAFLLGALEALAEFIFDFNPGLIIFNQISQSVSYQTWILFLLIGIGRRLFSRILGVNLDSKKEKKFYFSQLYY
jgi:hypothetical protein